MSGTPEKILEHFLETMRLEATLNEATGIYMAAAVLLLPIKMDLLGEHCNVLLWKAPSGSFSQNKNYLLLWNNSKRIKEIQN